MIRDPYFLLGFIVLLIGVAIGGYYVCLQITSSEKKFGFWAKFFYWLSSLILFGIIWIQTDLTVKSDLNIREMSDFFSYIYPFIWIVLCMVLYLIFDHKINKLRTSLLVK